MHPMTSNDQREQEKVFLKLFLKKAPAEVTDEEVAYFSQNPDLIDEVTAPVNVHKLFLWAGALVGALLVALSKVLKFSVPTFTSEAVREFLVDIIFESGVALIGAAVTAYLLGILLNNQQNNAAKWRAEIRSRLDASNRSQGS